jgi:hypothetical protein
MIQVCELFFLKEGLETRAKNIMQILDDLLGPGAHQHPGWCGHATFLQSVERPCEVMMIYPWRSKELHAELRDREEPLLAGFYARYCAAPRRISIYEEMAVEVEDDHHVA